MKSARKRILSLAIALMLIISLGGCSSETAREVTPNWPAPAMTAINTPPQVTDPPTTQSNPAEPKTWGIYWYLCGSDLETYGGFATTDLAEMMQVTLPENVQVIIQTGGAEQWQNDTISANAMGRYLYSGDTLTMISEEPDANMSDPKTLSSFLQFCNANYPAERQVVILWDHGGGSLGGVICDERSADDAISLPELKSALAAAPAASGK